MIFHPSLNGSTNGLQRLFVFFLIIQTRVKKVCVSQGAAAIVQRPLRRRDLKQWNKRISDETFVRDSVLHETDNSELFQNVLVEVRHHHVTNKMDLERDGRRKLGQ